ncbi:Oxoglutarate/iron-dependent oxygenase [Niveomyces insectorum RCEF 264]|uniref:Oxoglutarate/iron-dependent oxygenase n=1 Tax=Niveomyces insectorum RCEF 264 TaxID=1081102 RepID=A0A167QQM0_9HYPO|nr:Oxoglutarate/iron-dependent oxygenase [Niveomyces insectorum RCEF 264]
MASPAGLSLPPALDRVRIPGLPATAYYIASFITEEEERLLLQKIEAAPKPRWKQLSHRRLQTWPSDLLRDKLLDAPLPAWLVEPVITRLLAIPVGEKDDAGGGGGGCNDGNDSSKRDNIFSASPHQRPNHVLINEYPPGVGIMPHKDGSAYHPVVCTVSLGASLCLNLYQTKDDGALDPEPVARILQEPRSLLITTDDLYTEYLHGIADLDEDSNLAPATVANWNLLRSNDAFASGRNKRQTRTSLTYRDVLKVSKLGSKLGMLGRRP